jgi:hypothetical protein
MEIGKTVKVHRDVPEPQAPPIWEPVEKPVRETVTVNR